MGPAQRWTNNSASASKPCSTTCLAVVLLILLAVPAKAQTTYRVNKNGSDANSCATAATATNSSDTNAKLTINNGAKCMSGGDILVVGEGTYTEGLDNIFPSGTADAPTKFQPEVGEDIRIDGVTSSSTVNILQIENRSYITIDGLQTDRTGITFVPSIDLVHAGMFRIGANDGTGAGSHNLVFRNFTMDGNGHQGVCFDTRTSSTATSSKWIIDNLLVFDCGDSASNLYHGMYLSIRDSTVENSEIHTVRGGHGIHQYDSARLSNLDNNVYRNNLIYNTGSSGIGLYHGSGSLVANNSLRDTVNRWDGTGAIRAHYGASSVTIINNNIQRTNGSNDCILLASGSGHSVRNNTCWQNSLNTITDRGSGNTISDNNFASTEPSPETLPSATISPPKNLRLVDN